MSKTQYEDRWYSKVERFNSKFPPGTFAVYTSRNGFKFKTQVRYPAVVLASGVPVVWLRNIREYVPLDRVEALL